MPDDALRIARQSRDLPAVSLRFVRERAADGAAGLVRVSFSASSEQPVERWYGTEVLSHDPSAVRLTRAAGGAIPLLFNHNFADPVGMADSVRVVDGRLEVDGHLFDTARAQDVAKMIEGGMRNISVGYQVHAMEEQTKTQTYTATDWEPIEFSFAPVPADATIGVDRASAEQGTPVRVTRATPPATVPAVTIPTAQPAETRGAPAMPDGNHAPAGGTAVQDNPAQPRQGPSALEMEQMRQRSINSLAKANKIDDNVREHWIGAGLSVDAVADDILRIVEERSKNLKPATHLGLSPKETRAFSLFRAVAAAADKNWTQAGYELECSREIAKRLDKMPDPNTFFVPYDILERSIEVPTRYLKRDMTVASGPGGGYLVETANVSFIEMLRNRAVCYRMGARRLGGLVGNITIPRQSGAATAAWLANEAATITEGQQTLQQVAMSPKTVGAYTEISRQALLQTSPAIEGIVTSDLSVVTALAVDTGILTGTGASGQPTGIINTAGIGSVAGASIAYAGVLEFQTDVAGANVMPIAGGYVTTPTVAALLMQRVKFTSTASPLWEGNIWDGNVSGFPAMSSLQVPAANILFGDWAQVVVGEWGTLQIDVNPFANFQAGIIGIRAITSLDVALRYAGAFSLATSVT